MDNPLPSEGGGGGKGGGGGGQLPTMDKDNSRGESNTQQPTALPTPDIIPIVQAAPSAEVNGTDNVLKALGVFGKGLSTGLGAGRLSISPKGSPRASFLSKASFGSGEDGGGGSSSARNSPVLSPSPSPTVSVLSSFPSPLLAAAEGIGKSFHARRRSSSGAANAANTLASIHEGASAASAEQQGAEGGDVMGVGMTLSKRRLSLKSARKKMRGLQMLSRGWGGAAKVEDADGVETPNPLIQSEPVTNTASLLAASLKEYRPSKAGGSMHLAVNNAIRDSTHVGGGGGGGLGGGEGEKPQAILGSLVSETKKFLERANSRRLSNPTLPTSSDGTGGGNNPPGKLEVQGSLRSILAGGGGSSSKGPAAVAATSAIKQKFTVTDEILKQIKMNNFKQQQAKAAWSPTWQKSAAGYAPMDTEALVNSYVDLVCDDLKTNEKKRVLTGERAVTKCVVDPGASWRMRWDFMILMLVIWTSYSVPYRAAFGYEHPLLEAMVDLVVDLTFLADVGLNFFTAYHENEGIVQTDLKKIARRYLKTWFILDLISSIPTSDFTDGQSSVHYVFLFFKLLKLLRLVRFLRYMDSKEVAMFFTPSMLRLVNTFVGLTWVWHCITCIYWYISVSEGLGSTGWTPDPSAAENPAILNYFLGFVWTVQATFSCSPFSPPESLIESVFTILVYLVGIFMNAYVIGSAGSALQSLDEEKTQRRQLMDRIITYMKKRQLPSYFQRIILDFYNYMSEKHSEEGILTDLPPAIQLRLSLLLNRELVKNIPLLKQLELNTIIGLMQTLQSTMYLPGEYVFKAGEKGTHLYFVKTGQLEIMVDTVNVASHLQKGDMFGQIALTTDGCHDFNVRAAVYSEVLTLNREAYDDLSAESEKFMELVEMEAIKQEQFIIKAQKNLMHFAKIGRHNSSKRDLGEGDGRAALSVSASKVVAATGVVDMFRKNTGIRLSKIIPIGSDDNGGDVSEKEEV